MAVPDAPGSLRDFAAMFPDEGTCIEYLEGLRWPQGFVCPRCDWHGEPYRFTESARRARCRACKATVHLTAGTVMDHTHMPLDVWFWAAYLVTSQTPGMSALQFQRQIGISRYETAFQMLHKLRAGMVRPQRDRIGLAPGVERVEVDEAYVGGRTRGEGRGKTHKALVAAAVEVRRYAEGREPAYYERGQRKRRLFYAGRLRLRHVQSRKGEQLQPFVHDAVEPGANVVTDAWKPYGDLGKLGYEHESHVVGGDPEEATKWLPMVHLVFSNLKTWLQGTHHGVSRKHLQAYLNEFVFRFNRRFYPMTAFHSVLGIAVRVPGPTYEGVYAGEWRHPNPRFAGLWGQPDLGSLGLGEGREDVQA